MSVMPRKCPACGGEMHVCQMRCAACGTDVQGEYRLSWFARLTEEQLAFLETFIRCRGNLKDVGTAVGVSYPTARSRLDNLVDAMGRAREDEAAARRLALLEQVKDGALSVDEALEQLQGN
jgi:hypothetical protein